MGMKKTQKLNILIANREVDREKEKERERERKKERERERERKRERDSTFELRFVVSHFASRYGRNITLIALL